MASVWIQTRQRKGEREVRAVGNDMCSLFEYGLPTGLMWCEFLSPPSAPEPGQAKRAVKQ